MSFRSGFATGIKLALLLLVVLEASSLQINESIESTRPQGVTLSTPSTLSYSGIDPTALSLNWTEDTDPTFLDYDLQRFSNILNGWETVAALTPRTETTFLATGLTPGFSNSWRILYQDSSSSYLSNTLPVPQPSEPTLSFSRSADTSVNLQWTNNAFYGGLLQFSSYQIIASINGARNFTVVSINQVKVSSFTESNLLPSNMYTFYLNTTDECLGAGCPSPNTFTSSLSNKITISTPGPLSVSQLLSPASVDVGQPVSLTCLANGGSPPYSYSWNFGDGTTGLTGAYLTHTFGKSGSFPVTCSSSDSLGAIANAASSWVQVIIELSIQSFTATPTTLQLGQSVTFVVTSLGGNGSLTYSYANLPPDCTSLDSSTITCTPHAGGDYDVTATVTDQGHESSTSTTHITVSSARILGLPPQAGLTLLYGSAAIALASASITIILGFRRRTTRRSRSSQDIHQKI